MKKIKASNLGFRKNPAFGRGMEGGEGQNGEWPSEPQAPNPARLFPPGCSPPGPDTRLTCLGPNLPSSLHPAPQPRRSGFPAGPRPLLGAGGGGVAFPGRAMGHVTRSWTRSDSALTDRHQMLFRAAPRSERSFRFSTDRRKQGLGGGCTRHEPPAPGRGGGGGRSGMAARLSQSGALRTEVGW